MTHVSGENLKFDSTLHQKQISLLLAKSAEVTVPGIAALLQNFKPKIFVVLNFLFL